MVTQHKTKNPISSNIGLPKNDEAIVTEDPTVPTVPVQTLRGVPPNMPCRSTRYKDTTPARRGLDVRQNHDGCPSRIYHMNGSCGQVCRVETLNHSVFQVVLGL
jgi:hypothetical protein